MPDFFFFGLFFFPKVQQKMINHSKDIIDFLCVKIKRTCTHVRSTQMGPLRNLFLQESGLSVYTSL